MLRPTNGGSTRGQGGARGRRHPRRRPWHRSRPRRAGRDGLRDRAQHARPALGGRPARDDRGDRRARHRRGRHRASRSRSTTSSATRCARSSRGSRPSRAASTCSSTTSGAASSCSSGTRRCGSTTSRTGCGWCAWAIETHLITSHHALPLLIARPGGLVVEVTDGTAEYNAEHYRNSLFYDLAKNAVTRLAWAQAQELAPHGATAVALTPGWLRSEAMLEAFGVTEETWREAVTREPHFCISEIAGLRRPRRRGAGRRSRRGALERAVAVERRPRAGLRLHRHRWHPARRVALHRRGHRGGAPGGRHGLPLSTRGTMFLSTLRLSDR